MIKFKSSPNALTQCPGNDNHSMCVSLTAPTTTMEIVVRVMLKGRDTVPALRIHHRPLVRTSHDGYLQELQCPQKQWKAFLTE